MGRRIITHRDIVTTAEIPDGEADYLDLASGRTPESGMRPSPCVRTLAWGSTSKGWLARLTGLDPKWQLEREFLDPRERMSSGLREFVIEEEGLYEADSAVTRGPEIGAKARRTFFQVHGTRIHVLEREEALDLLRREAGGNFGEVRGAVARRDWELARAEVEKIAHPAERAAALQYVDAALERAERELPTLEGTPKQRTWASELRRDALAALEELRAQMRRFERDHPDEDFSRVFARYERAEDIARALDTSHTWIEARERLGGGRAVVRCMIELDARQREEASEDLE